MQGDSPQRDRDIEDIQKMIAACAQVGIPSIKYNMSLLGVLRTKRTPGRGGGKLQYLASRRSQGRSSNHQGWSCDGSNGLGVHQLFFEARDTGL